LRLSPPPNRGGRRVLPGLSISGCLPRPSGGGAESPAPGRTPLAMFDSTPRVSGILTRVGLRESRGSGSGPSQPANIPERVNSLFGFVRLLDPVKGVVGPAGFLRRPACPRQRPGRGAPGPLSSAGLGLAGGGASPFGAGGWGRHPLGSGRRTRSSSTVLVAAAWDGASASPAGCIRVHPSQLECPHFHPRRRADHPTGWRSTEGLRQERRAAAGRSRVPGYSATGCRSQKRAWAGGLRRSQGLPHGGRLGEEGSALAGQRRDPLRIFRHPVAGQRVPRGDLEAPSWERSGLEGRPAMRSAHRPRRGRG
jgi:hypothetical protein